MSLLRAARQSLRVARLENPSCLFSASSLYNEKSAIPQTDKPRQEPAEPDVQNILREANYHKVSNLEKRLLVWSRHFKSLDDVPPTVPQSTMDKSRNRARIKISIYMMFATLVGCITMVYTGKEAVKRGETVLTRNVEWHKDMNKKFAKDEATKDDS